MADWDAELEARARAAAAAEATDGADPLILVREDEQIAPELIAALAQFYTPGLADQVVRLVEDLRDAEATLAAVRRVAMYADKRGMPSGPRFVLNGKEILEVLDRRRSDDVTRADGARCVAGSPHGLGFPE
jgi:hypothetical protein